MLTPEQKRLAKPLTSLNKKFVINIVSGMSQRQAYVAAGGCSKSERAQDANAARMIANDKVKAFYDSLVDAAANDAILTRQRALELLSQSAEVTITDVCEFITVEGEDKNGQPVSSSSWHIKDFNTISPDIAKCVKSIAMTRDGPKLELYDRHDAIKQLAKMQGWESAKKHEVTGADGEAIKTTFVFNPVSS